MLVSDGAMLTDGETSFTKFIELIKANSLNNKLHTIGVGSSLKDKDK